MKKVEFPDDPGVASDTMTQSKLHPSLLVAKAILFYHQRVQQALFDLASPLDLKIGREFFSEIPRLPGVYQMFDDHGEILYVGKAKNLRTRLMSYRRIKITSSSVKSLRLVHQISEIKWQICESEEMALIKENELLRDLKPPFNVVNISPETYFYFAVVVTPSREDFVEVNLTLSMNESNLDGAVFGAFKGIASCHRAFLSLRRLLWLVSARDENEALRYPLHLIRRQKLHPYQCEMDKVWLNRLAGFLHGFSLSPIQKEPELILSFREFAARMKNCDQFHQDWIQQDIDSLLKFYRSGPARNAQLKALSSSDSPTISQNKIDDLIVKRSFS